MRFKEFQLANGEYVHINLDHILFVKDCYSPKCGDGNAEIYLDQLMYPGEYDDDKFKSFITTTPYSVMKYILEEEE